MRILPFDTPIHEYEKEPVTLDEDQLIYYILNIAKEIDLISFIEIIKGIKLASEWWKPNSYGYMSFRGGYKPIYFLLK